MLATGGDGDGDYLVHKTEQEQNREGTEKEGAMEERMKQAK
jgi:hypothetical protein